jgi:hypothetical protein
MAQKLHQKNLGDRIPEGCKGPPILMGCSYIISTLPLKKKGILQQNQAREVCIISGIRRTVSSISSWNIGWKIYKSSEVFFIDSIIILERMPSSFASICINKNDTSSQH